MVGQPGFQFGGVDRLLEKGNLRGRLHQVRLGHFLVLDEQPIAAFEALRLSQVLTGYLDQFSRQREPVKRCRHGAPQIPLREHDIRGGGVLVRFRPRQLSAQTAGCVDLQPDIAQIAEYSRIPLAAT